MFKTNYYTILFDFQDFFFISYPNLGWSDQTYLKFGLDLINFYQKNPIKPVKIQKLVINPQSDIRCSAKNPKYGNSFLKKID